MESSTGAPVDQFGNKTPTWDMLRHINLQIHKLGPTYLKLKSVNVFHHPDIPERCVGLETSKHLAEINVPDGSDGSLLVGEFESPEGRPFVMVVNKSLHHSSPFFLKFKREGPVVMTNSYTGRTHAWGREQDWLAPGQGMLLSVRK
jgi:hypothetical protein